MNAGIFLSLTESVINDCLVEKMYVHLEVRYEREAKVYEKFENR
jgi:hypothetical protein